MLGNKSEVADVLKGLDALATTELQTAVALNNAIARESTHSYAYTCTMT